MLNFEIFLYASILILFPWVQFFNVVLKCVSYMHFAYYYYYYYYYLILTYLLTYSVGRVLEKLTGPQLVKKFPLLYGNRRFITAFTSARELSLS